MSCPSRRAPDAHALLPDEQMDGVFEAVVSHLDMAARCATEPDTAATDPDAPIGLGFWASL